MKRHILSALAAAVVLGCTALAVATPPPLLVWNSTASAPMGLYHRHFGGIARGDWVLIRPPPDVAKLAATRNYFPQTIALIKRIAAQGGDRVCRVGDTISINGRNAALAIRQDSRARDLPTWSGCVALKPDEIFVLNAPSGSFDSRYFGPISRHNVIERIAPLWTF